eukprot:scaffold672394_cov83-Prasinocladus_malaysianus.AAC.1
MHVQGTVTGAFKAMTWQFLQQKRPFTQFMNRQSSIHRLHFRPTEYKKRNVLQGSSSKVYKAICKISQEVVILKAYVKQRLHEIHHVQIMREISIHSNMCHPNIISFFGSFEDDDYYYIVEEYAESGDLFDIIRAQKALLPEHRVVNLVAVPLLQALDYVHQEV